MRLLTFSFLKSCKFKPIFGHFPRRLRSDAVRVDVDEKVKGDANMIDASAWPLEEHIELRTAALRDMTVMPDFITPDEELELLHELDPVLKRMRYEYDHWDNAIHGFKETERLKWNDNNSRVVERVREAARAAGGGELLPHAHILDLAPNGHIKPHVDAVRFCGPVIAGLCLHSTAVMQLQHTQHKELMFDALLPRRGLYIMRGVARYSFTHAVVGGAGAAPCSWRGQRVVKQRRVAIICRSQPQTLGEHARLVSIAFGYLYQGRSTGHRGGGGNLSSTARLSPQRMLSKLVGPDQKKTKK